VTNVLLCGLVCNVYGIGLAIERPQVQILVILPSGYDFGQVYAHVPLSPSSTTWYWPKCLGGNGSMWGRCGLPPT